MDTKFIVNIENDLFKARGRRGAKSEGPKSEGQQARAAKREHLNYTHRTNPQARHEYWADIAAPQQKGGGTKASTTFHKHRFVPHTYKVTSYPDTDPDVNNRIQGQLLGDHTTGGYHIIHHGPNTHIVAFDPHDPNDLTPTFPPDMEGMEGTGQRVGGVITDPTPFAVFQALERHLKGHRAKLLSDEGKQFVESGVGKDLDDHLASHPFTKDNPDFARYVKNVLVPPVGADGKLHQNAMASTGAHGVRGNHEDGKVILRKDARALNRTGAAAALALPHGKYETETRDGFLKRLVEAKVFPDTGNKSPIAGEADVHKFINAINERARRGADAGAPGDASAPKAPAKGKQDWSHLKENEAFMNVLALLKTKKGKANPPVIRKPDSIAALAGMPHYNTEKQADGTLKIVGAINPDTGQWIGKRPPKDAQGPASAPAQAQVQAPVAGSKTSPAQAQVQAPVAAAAAPKPAAAQPAAQPLTGSQQRTQAAGVAPLPKQAAVAAPTKFTADPKKMEALDNIRKLMPALNAQIAQQQNGIAELMKLTAGGAPLSSQQQSQLDQLQAQQKATQKQYEQVTAALAQMSGQPTAAPAAAAAAAPAAAGAPVAPEAEAEPTDANLAEIPKPPDLAPNETMDPNGAVREMQEADEPLHEYEFTPHTMSLDEYRSHVKDRTNHDAATQHLHDNHPGVFSRSKEVKDYQSTIKDTIEQAKGLGLQFEGRRLVSVPANQAQKRVIKELKDLGEDLVEAKVKAAHRAYIDEAFLDNRDHEMNIEQIKKDHGIDPPEFRREHLDLDDEFMADPRSKQITEKEPDGPATSGSASPSPSAPAPAPTPGGLLGKLQPTVPGTATGAERGPVGSLTPVPNFNVPHGVDKVPAGVHVVNKDTGVGATRDFSGSGPDLAGAHADGHGVYTMHVKDSAGPKPSMELYHHSKSLTEAGATLVGSHPLAPRGADAASALAAHNLAKQSLGMTADSHHKGMTASAAGPAAISPAPAATAPASTPAPTSTPATAKPSLMSKIKGLFGKSELVIDIRKANNLHTLTKGAEEQPRKYVNKQVTKTGNVKHIYRLPAASFQSPSGQGAPATGREVDPGNLATKLRTTSGVLGELARKAGSPEKFVAVVREQAPAFVRKHGVTDAYLTSIYRALHKQTVVNKAEKDDPCWDGYEMVGMKRKRGKRVPNCVPKT